MNNELKRILRSAYADTVLKMQKPTEATALLASASQDTVLEARAHLKRINAVRGQCFIARTEADFLSEALAAMSKNGVVGSGRIKGGNIDA